MARDQFKKAQKAINKESRRLEQQRLGGLQYSLDAVNSIYANLGTTQRGIARSMTSSNDRTLSRLIAANQRSAAASAKAVGAATSGMVSQYGGLYSGQVAQQMGVAQANSQGVGTAAQAGIRTAKGMAKAGTLGLAIEQAGAADAQAAAQYALAQASSARARADAEAIAQMQLELELQKLSQAGGALSTAFPGLDSVARTAAGYSKEIRSAIPEIMAQVEEANREWSPTSGTPKAQFMLADVVNLVMNRLAISPDSPEQALVQVLAQEIYARKLWYGQTNAASVQLGGDGKGRQNEIEIITTAVMRAYDGNVSAKDRAAIQDYVTKYLKQIYGNQSNPVNKPAGNYGVEPPAAAAPGATTTRIAAPDSMYGNSPNAIGKAETESTILVPTYAANLAAGIELYILLNPGASETEARERVRANLDTGGAVPNYVEELRKYKANN